MANNVNLLVNAVVLNYMALHDQVNNGNFSSIYQQLGFGHGLGNDLERFIAFNPIVNGTVPAA